MSKRVTRSRSMLLLRTTPQKDLTRAASTPEMKPKSSFEEFTPTITADESDDESYLFQCSSPGLYQCSVSGLLFVMKAEGDVVYRTVPWNRRLLALHHKKPAGPLFDIKCLQQTVCQLHLPHCEVISTGGGQFLQVAHVGKLEGIEFIPPQHITKTHVVINMTGFSAFGVVSYQDPPPGPVQALVLLFYKPPVNPYPRSVLSVLLVPRNVVIRDVKRTRRELNGEEMYIDTPSRCSLFPNQVYTLSVPDDDLIMVQPKTAEFDEQCFDNSVTSFQVIFNRDITDINLSLTHQSSSSCVWEREVCFLPNRVRTISLPPNERLLNVFSSFIDGISAPVLSSLLDKLLEKKVITDAEREEADAMLNTRTRARFVIDTVRKKGDAASSEMIESLCDLDPFFCQYLGLI